MFDIQLTSSYDLQDIWEVFNASYGFPETKILYTHKCCTVDFDVWPRCDLQFGPPNDSYDLQWHLSSILMQDMNSLTLKSYNRTPRSAPSRFSCLTSSWPLILTSKQQLWPPVLSEQYSNARYGIPDTKILWKDDHKYYSVYFNVRPPFDLKYWPPNGSYDLQWHLNSIPLPDMDSPTQKSYKRTPISVM